MTEAEFSAMLARAAAKKAEAQDRYKAHSDRRQAILTKAINSNRVTPDLERVEAEPDRQSLRQHFDEAMNRTLRRHLGSVVGDSDEADS